MVESVIAGRAFCVTDDGIYFITGTTSDSTSVIVRTLSDTIQFYNFHTQQRKTLAKVENAWFYLSISPDGKYLLYSLYNQAGNDLMLVENFK